MNKNMRIMRMHEAVGAYGPEYLFCSAWRLTKQIYDRVNGVFCLMLPHMPHVFQFVQTGKPQKMRHMREYEDRVFKGFYLFRIGMGGAAGPFYEDSFEKHEADPHVLDSSGLIRGLTYAILFSLPVWAAVLLAVWAVGR